MKKLFFVRSIRKEKSFQAESISIYINFPYIYYLVAGGVGIKAVE